MCIGHNTGDFFGKLKIFLLLEELPQKTDSIFYKRIKVCIVNWFESVNFTDMDQLPNCITCST
jgi:hypothetical protein